MKFKEMILNEDVKKNMMKSQGLKTLGWGVYIDKQSKKYKWDGNKFTQIEMPKEKEEPEISDKGINKTKLRNSLKIKGFSKNEFGKFTLNYKTPKQKTEAIETYKMFIQEFGEGLKKEVDSKKGIVKFSNNTVHLFTVKKQNAHGVNSIIVDFD
jgi:hypothetical protein